MLYIESWDFNSPNANFKQQIWFDLNQICTVTGVNAVYKTFLGEFEV